MFDPDEVIREYRQSSPDFPHESTDDQFFTEGQFEAYRSLGQHIGEKVLAHATPGTMAERWRSRTLSRGLRCSRSWRSDALARAAKALRSQHRELEGVFEELRGERQLFRSMGFVSVTVILR